MVVLSMSPSLSPGVRAVLGVVELGLLHALPCTRVLSGVDPTINYVIPYRARADKPAAKEAGSRARTSGRAQARIGHKTRFRRAKRFPRSHQRIGTLPQGRDFSSWPPAGSL
jgi:hypothetical protein